MLRPASHEKKWPGAYLRRAPMYASPVRKKIDSETRRDYVHAAQGLAETESKRPARGSISDAAYMRPRFKFPLSVRIPFAAAKAIADITEEKLIAPLNVRTKKAIGIGNSLNETNVNITNPHGKPSAVGKKLRKLPLKLRA